MMHHPRTNSHRLNALWFAAMVHRVSGLLLVLFLPFHFLALALALEGEAYLDRFLRWTDNPLLKLAETLLVGLLAVHFLGGARILVVENLPWRPIQKQLAMGASALAALAALVFLIRVD
jgi:succinate dehydrogenase subunit D